MNTPFSTRGWKQLQNHAAAQLPEDFADRVLNQTRKESQGVASEAPWYFHSLSISALTATACLLTAVFFHQKTIRDANSRHIADWQEISMQTASLDPMP
jgi:hypothetical protein